VPAALTTRERFVAGDALRGYMSVLVVAMHTVLLGTLVTGSGTDVDGAFGKIPGRAIQVMQLSIYVFFTLSAYLLARPFLRAILAGERFPPVLDYLVGRFLRVIPGFWLITTLILLRFGARGSSHGEIVAIYGFAQTVHRGAVDQRINQAWTLDAEVFFYLVLPVVSLLAAFALHRLKSNAWKVGIGGAALAVVFVLSYRYRATAQAAWPEPNPLAMICAFIPGIGLATIEILGRDKLPGWRWGPRAAWACLGLAALGLLLSMTLAPHRLAARMLAGIVACTFFVAAPMLMQWTRGRPWRFFEWKPAHWLGIRSFSFYLIHTAILLELVSWARHGHTALAATALALPPTLVISAVLAAISFRLVEVPGMSLRKPIVRLLRAVPARTSPGSASSAPGTPPR
jgi:peptidoglycan/LPS O-acetylase OafA/YrhL